MANTFVARPNGAALRCEQKICRLLEVAASVGNTLGFVDGSKERQEHAIDLCQEYFQTLKEVQDDLARFILECPPARPYAVNPHAAFQKFSATVAGLQAVSEQVKEAAAAMQAARDQESAD